LPLTLFEPFDTADGTVVLHLAKGAPVTGTLTVRGAPPGPSSFTFSPHPHGGPVSAVTDADGGFAFVTLPGRVDLEFMVVNAQHRAVRRRVQATAPADVEVTVDVDAELEALERRWLQKSR